MENGNGVVRKPTVHFSDDIPKIAAPNKPINGQLENNRIIGVRHFDRPQIPMQSSSIDNEHNGRDAQIQQQQPNKNHCSNKLFLAILLSILVLVLGAIAITLILVLSRDKDKGDQKEQQRMIINFGDDNCIDLATNCAENKALCKNDFYKGMMTIYCRKSCGLCTVPFLFTPNPAFCFDKPGYSQRCANWKRNGFCENTFWPESTRREYCAKTCAFC